MKRKHENMNKEKSLFKRKSLTEKRVKGMPMTNVNTKTIASLEQQIAAGKRQLQAAYDACGCTNSIVLAYSIRLDKLIVQYHKLNGFYKINTLDSQD
jgi:hypothetical protein